MSLNIKREEAHQLALELAEITGETLTSAVTTALRERLARERARRGAGDAERWLAIGRDCAARLREPHRSEDHGALLHDDAGLPR